MFSIALLVHRYVIIMSYSPLGSFDHFDSMFCNKNYFHLLFPTSQGYNKEKIPKGKTGPQPDLKIKKVHLLFSPMR